MGVFDTMSGYTECPNCSSFVSTDIQFKWGEPMMAVYHVGSYIDGHEPLHRLSCEHVVCPHCKERFLSTAIGRFGYLFGFCNPVQIEKINHLLPSEDKETSKKIDLIISPSLENNPEEVVRLFQEAFLKDSTKDFYYIGTDEGDYSEHICRWNSLISPERIRPQVGDKVFYDNRRSFNYEFWELKDEIFVVKEAVLDEECQLYRYTIESNNHRFENIWENKVLDETERNKRASETEELIRQVIAASKGEKQLSFILRLHGRTFIQTMKEKGLIPHDFDIDAHTKKRLDK